MVSTAVLRQQAMWAYELGQLRRASRVAFVIAMLVLAVIWETGRASSAVSLGFALAIASVLLRWRHRRRADDVRAGLVAGMVPLVTSLMVCHIGVACSVTLSIVLCGSAGAVAGVALGRYVAHSEDGVWGRWLTSAVVAGLTSSLGCGALNAGAIVGILAGMLGASLVSAVVRTARPLPVRTR